MSAPASDRPLVSVCIPTFRRPVQLEQALRSVLAQTYPNFEIVVSDDSGDQEQVVRRLDDARIHYFRNEPHAGMAANFNLSLDRAGGELIGFLHDDDRWLPQFLERVVGHFTTDPALDLVFTNHYLERADRLSPSCRQVPGFSSTAAPLSAGCGFSGAHASSGMAAGAPTPTHLHQ